MLVNYIIPSFRVNFLFKKVRLLRDLPIFGRLYRSRMLHNDLFTILRLKSRLQERLSREIFGEHIAGIAFETYNGLLVNSPSDVEINRRLGFFGSYDKKKVAFLLSLLKPDDQVFIVGAHIGTLTIPVAKAVRKVVAFEANPATFRYLDWNVRLNHLPNVQVYNYAIYSEEVQIPFYQNKANSGGSKVKPVTDHHMYNYDHPDEIRVEGKVLDDLVTRNNIDFPDMIVMDIEGAESAALKGANACLSHARYLYIEFEPHHLTNVANVSVEDFTAAITKHFPYMRIVDDMINEDVKVYEGAAILQILSDLYHKNSGEDLLFYK